MIERLFGNARRPIGKARKSDHRQAKCSCLNRFQHRAHAHRIGTDRTQHADLRRRFKLRPTQPGIHTFMQAHARSVRRFAKLRTPSGIISHRHIDKLRTHKRRGAGEIHMIAQHHPFSRRIILIQRARGIRQHQAVHTLLRHPPHARRHDLRGMPFIQMHPTLHHQHLGTRKTTAQKFSRMPRHRRLRDARILKCKLGIDLDLICQWPQPGSQYHSNHAPSLMIHRRMATPKR